MKFNDCNASAAGEGVKPHMAKAVKLAQNQGAMKSRFPLPTFIFVSNDEPTREDRSDVGRRSPRSVLEIFFGHGASQRGRAPPQPGAVRAADEVGSAVRAGLFYVGPAAGGFGPDR